MHENALLDFAASQANVRHLTISTIAAVVLELMCHCITIAAQSTTQGHTPMAELIATAWDENVPQKAGIRVLAAVVHM